MNIQNLNVMKKSMKHPCGVSLTGVGANSIYCRGCSHWVHKKCSGLAGALKEDPKCRCSRCQGTDRQIDGRPIIELQMGKDKLDVVPEFCYLGDMTWASAGCDLTVIARCKSNVLGESSDIFFPYSPAATSRMLSMAVSTQHVSEV